MARGRYEPWAASPSATPPAERTREPSSSPAGRAAANSSTEAADRAASNLTEDIAQSLIVGGLVGFTTSSIGMLLIGWLRRRL